MRPTWINFARQAFAPAGASRGASPGRRWEQFARAIAGRYGKGRDRARRARMTLVDARPVVNRYALSFAAACPRIHLAVQWALNPQWGLNPAVPGWGAPVAAAGAVVAHAGISRGAAGTSRDRAGASPATAA